LKVCFVHNTPVLLSLSLFLYTLTVDLERTAQPLPGQSYHFNAREAEQMLMGSNWIFTGEERAEIEKALTLWES